MGVAPSAIYHHYESQAAIVQAATELVWEEATRDFLAAIPDPFGEDPAEVLVTAGIATRRAFGRHYRIAPFLAASPETTEFMAELLGMLAGVFERLGLQGEDASVSFHTYASFTIGAVLFAATRRVANEKLGIAGKQGQKPSGRPSLDDAIDIPATDPARDEELFAAGLRRLIQSFLPAP